MQHSLSSQQSDNSEASPYQPLLGKNQFISPELAYSNEKRKLYEKIGYLKQTQGNTAIHIHLKNTLTPTKDEQQAELMQAFRRRKGKMDDSYYEKRANTLSKRQSTNLPGVRRYLLAQQEQGDSMNAQQMLYSMTQDEESSRSFATQQASFMGRRQQRDRTVGDIMPPRMQTAGGYGSKKDRSMEHRIASTKGFTYALDESNAYLVGTTSQNRTQRGLKANAQGNGRIGAMPQLPEIQGISQAIMLELYEAKCKDLQINQSREQMLRFFDILHKNITMKPRRLSLHDQGLGDHSAAVIAKLLKRNEHFAELVLSKNFITCVGMKHIASSLMHNTSLVSCDIGCNSISVDGAIALFEALKHQKSIVSLSLANTDCYKNKNKIGTKGAMVLGEMLQMNQQLQMLNLADNSISQEGLMYIIRGLKHAPHLISLNLSQNDIGSNLSAFTKLLTIFSPSDTLKGQVICASLEELNISQNQLSNKNIEDLANILKSCEKTRLQRLNLSSNKINAKGFLNLIQAFRVNQQLKITHLNLDKNGFELGSRQEQVQNYFTLSKLLVEYLRSTKTNLQSLSLNQCAIGKDFMSAIGKGLSTNDKLHTLSLRGNHIECEALEDFLNSCEINTQMRLKHLDLSYNRLNDTSGATMVKAFSKVDTLETINLRSNGLGVEAGERLLYLVQQKKNLWRLQVEMNVIKYESLLEIQKICTRNKRNAKVMYIPEIQEQIEEYQAKKEKAHKQEEIDRQLRFQQEVLREGRLYIKLEEEAVHQVMQAENFHVNQKQLKTKTLKEIIEKQQELLDEQDQQLQDLQREQQRKLDQEAKLVQRYQDFREDFEEKLRRERVKLRKKRELRKEEEEERKLKEELAKIERENQMLLVIQEGYLKELDRRRNQVVVVVEQSKEGQINHHQNPFFGVVGNNEDSMHKQQTKIQVKSRKNSKKPHKTKKTAKKEKLIGDLLIK